MAKFKIQNLIQIIYGKLQDKNAMKLALFFNIKEVGKNDNGQQKEEYFFDDEA